MHTCTPAKEPRGNYSRVIENEEFIAAKKFRQLCELGILKSAGAAIHNQQT